MIRYPFFELLFCFQCQIDPVSLAEIEDHRQKRAYDALINSPFVGCVIIATKRTVVKLVNWLLGSKSPALDTECLGSAVVYLGFNWIDIKAAWLLLF
ncbi:MAG: hypothetical protein ACE5HI_01960 [bacterium]